LKFKKKFETAQGLFESGKKQGLMIAKDILTFEENKNVSWTG